MPSGRSPSPPTIRCRPRPGDLPGLGERLERRLCGSGPGVILCETVALAGADAGCVDALARAALVAHHHGWRLRLIGPSVQLCELIDLMGLTEVLLGSAEREPAG